MGESRIRPYEPADRARVRHICFVTGYIGEPVDWQWRDAESFADIFTGYYTDAEPQSALVAEIDGEVVGYLLGCVDSSRAWNPATVVGRQITRRGIAFRPGTAGFVWRAVGDVIVDAAHRRLPPSPFADSRWPAHLHIDLLRDARGRGVGCRPRASVARIAAPGRCPGLLSRDRGRERRRGGLLRVDGLREARGSPYRPRACAHPGATATTCN